MKPFQALKSRSLTKAFRRLQELSHSEKAARERLGGSGFELIH